MTPDELREKVAKAIVGAEIAYFGPRSSREQCVNWYNERHCYLQAAEAAIAVALEEAARVAERMPCEPCRDGPQIAAAIRALISPDGAK